VLAREGVEFGRQGVQLELQAGQGGGRVPEAPPVPDRLKAQASVAGAAAKFETAPFKEWAARRSPGASPRSTASRMQRGRIGLAAV